MQITSCNTHSRTRLSRQRTASLVNPTRCCPTLCCPYCHLMCCVLCCCDVLCCSALLACVFLSILSLYFYLSAYGGPPNGLTLSVQFDSTPVQTVYSATNIQPNGGFQLISGTVTAPFSSPTTLTVRIAGYDNPQSVYVDDVSVVLVGTLPPPNSSSSFSSSSSGNAAAYSDPYFAGFWRQLFYVHGRPNNVYSIISDMDVQLNALFVFLDSVTCPTLPANTTARVHCSSHAGTYFGEMAFRTASGDLLHIVAGGVEEGLQAVTVTSAAGGTSQLAVGDSVGEPNGADCETDYSQTEHSGCGLLPGEQQQEQPADHRHHNQHANISHQHGMNDSTQTAHASRPAGSLYAHRLSARCPDPL